MSANEPKEEKLAPIIDKQGRNYRVSLFEIGTLWVIKVWDNWALAAEAKCLITGTELFLADIHVFEAAKHPFRRIDQIKAIFCATTSGRNENYRHRGLGTALLKLIIKNGRERSFRRITGTLAAKDIDENPYLATWYKHQGFDVTVKPDATTGEIVFSLCQVD